MSTTAAVESKAADTLAKVLRPRHVTMISIGGIIGAGLFVGSSAAIAAIGPAAVVSYALAGLIVMLVMRSIVALALAFPAAGAFTEFARLAFGGMGGFVAGWLYWYFWAVVIPIEAIAGAAIVAQWIALPVWLLSIALIAVMTASNLLSTRSYGEFEFWFAAIKVAAIVAFVAIVGGAALGLAGGGAEGLDRLAEGGGIAPRGWGAVVAGVTTVIFALVGVEIVTIAAAEADNSAALVARLTRSLVLRIILFYVVSIGLIVAVVPWREIVPGQSPFATALARVGIPAAAAIMQGVVLVAVLSCLNSAIYVASRALFTLAAHGDAPRSLVAVDSRGVPARAILIGTAFGFVALLANVASPQVLFTFLINASGAIILFVYFLTVLAALKLQVLARGATGWAAALAIVAVLAAMLRTPDLATQLYASLACLAVVVLAFGVTRSRRGVTP